MTTTTAADATTIRLKKMSNGGGVGNVNRNTPTTAINVTAHSNSIDSSTNYQSYYHQQQVLSSSPPGSVMSSGASTSSTSSDSSLGSSGVGSGHSSSRQRKHQQRKQEQTQQLQQQRDSPLLTSGSESGVFFSNNNHNYQTHYGGRRGGSSNKQRDGQKSPHFQQQQHQQQQTRQSPAVILGGGGNCVTINSNSGSAGRKTRAKFAISNSPLFGKVSPTQLLIPTALTHFAGSKCFDAPAPTALPKPPQHWTLGKAEHKTTSSAGPGLHSVTTARNPALAADAHTCGGHVVKHSKRNLLDDFDTHNLKLLLNVQS